MAQALGMADIVKAFDGRVALDRASFSADWGEVHGLLGENGAGKTSLMNVLAGLYLPDAGRIVIDGTARRIEGPAHARALGIGMVHQNFKLVRPFTVAENVMLANPQDSGRRGLATISDGIARLSDELGFEIDPDARIDRISVAEQQRVEIIKVLMGGARLLVLDEPTAVLTDEEAERLLRTVGVLARRGTCVILITHKLREVVAHADRVTVMRGGKTVATANARDTNAAHLARMMVGDAPADDTSAGQKGPLRLEISALTARRDDGVSTVRGLSLAVHGGHIYGVAGVGGNGQTELAEVLMGVRRPQKGRVTLDGDDITMLHPKRRRTLGMRNVPADRSAYGLAQELSVGDNYAATGLGGGAFGTALWVSRRAIAARTAAALAAFEIRGARVDTSARLLSGGNAQKLVLARELAGEPAVIVAHSPTRGLDVRACAAVHGHLRRARKAGAAVLLISEDLDEVLNLSDVVGVLNRGRIVGELMRPVDRRHIGELMLGHA